MEKRVVLQKVKKEEEDKYALAERYYGIMSSVNSLGLTQREIQLMAFACIRGNISYTEIKDDFCKRCNTSVPTINNMISRLRRVGVLVKDNGKMKVHPLLSIDFNKDVILEIHLYGKADVSLD